MQLRLSAAERARRETFSSPGQRRLRVVRSHELQFLEANVQLATCPRIGRRIRDLLWRQATRCPVRGLRTLGYAGTQEYRGEIPHARLLQAVASGNLAEVQH